MGGVCSGGGGVVSVGVVWVGDLAGPGGGGVLPGRGGSP